MKAKQDLKPITITFKDTTKDRHLYDNLKDLEERGEVIKKILRDYFKKENNK